MAEKRTIGLKTVKLGDIEADGGMGQTLAQLGVTYEGTAVLTKEEDEIKEFYCEENDDPIELLTKKGKTYFEFAIVDFQAATLQKVFGGTVDTTDPQHPVWKAPDQAPEIEQSVEIITNNDIKVEIPRGKLATSMDWKLGKEDIGQVKIRVTVMTPTKTGEPSLMITE